MTIESITELPDYGKLAAEHNNALSEAATAGDQDKIAQLKTQWDRTTLTLERQMDQTNRQQAALAAAQAKAKTDFAQVPEEVYAHLTDPEAILAAAKKAQDAMTAVAPPAAGGTPQGWGGAPATAPPGTAPVPAQVVPYDDFVAGQQAQARVVQSPAGKQAKAAIFDAAMEAKIIPALTRGQGEPQQ